MPTIAKPQRKPSDRVKQRQKLYQRTDYRKIVTNLKQSKVFCEECLKDGVYSIGTDCHHIVSPFQGNLSEQEKLALLCDPQNLILLCSFHHKRVHGTASKESERLYQEKVRLAQKLTLQSSHTKNGGDKNDTPQ